MTNAPQPKTRYYISNIFRWRFWQFSILTAVLVGVGMTFIGANSTTVTIVFVLTIVAVGWYWLTVQMACRYCGTVLRVTRLSGEQEICQKCHRPTDRNQ